VSPNRFSSPTSCSAGASAPEDTAQGFRPTAPSSDSSATSSGLEVDGRSLTVQASSRCQDLCVREA
jgi:hypothetical protein